MENIGQCTIGAVQERRGLAIRRLAGSFLGIAVCLQTACSPPVELPPNVLMIVVDDLNTDLGSYGHPLVQTPNIDRLAGRGVLFTRAYTQYPQCNQSRSSMLTGLYPDQIKILTLKDHFRDQRPELVTLPQHFRNNGYFTARVGKVFHQGVPVDIGNDGLDDPLSWDLAINPSGVDREVEDEIVTIVPPEKDKRRFGGILSWLSVADTGRKHTDEIGADEAIRLLEENNPQNTGKPFFLALGFYRPHTPYVAPESFFNLYPLEQIQPLVVPPGDRENKPVAALADRKYQADMSELQKREAIQGYYASISFIDAQLGRVTTALDEFGLTENTLIVFVSDHGYQLGSHGLWQKQDLFENSARTPLIMVAPGQLEAGLKSPLLTELTDIYPTLVSLAGIESPDTRVDGQDLKAVLKGEQPGRELALSQSWSAAHLTRAGWKAREVMGYSIRTERFRYTEWGRGEYGNELYDYRMDPTEFHNLAGTVEYESVTRLMKSLLDKKLQSMRQSN